MKSFLGYSDTAPAPTPVEPPTITERVCDLLRARPGVYLTALQIADVTGLTRAQVNGVITNLRGQGLVDRLLGNVRGRDVGQAYRWNGGVDTPPPSR